MPHHTHHHIRQQERHQLQVPSQQAAGGVKGSGERPGALANQALKPSLQPAAEGARLCAEYGSWECGLQEGAISGCVVQEVLGLSHKESAFTTVRPVPQLHGSVAGQRLSITAHATCTLAD